MLKTRKELCGVLIYAETGGVRHNIRLKGDTNASECAGALLGFGDEIDLDKYEETENATALPR